MQQKKTLKLHKKERYLLLGDRAAEEGFLDEAVMHYERALALDGRYAQAHLHVSTVLLRQHKMSRAQYHYEQACRYNPALGQLHSGNCVVAAKQHSENHYHTTLNVIVPEEYLRHNSALKKEGGLVQPPQIARMIVGSKVR